MSGLRGLAAWRPTSMFPLLSTYSPIGHSIACALCVCNSHIHCRSSVRHVTSIQRYFSGEGLLRNLLSKLRPAWVSLFRVSVAKALCFSQQLQTVTRAK